MLWKACTVPTRRPISHKQLKVVFPCHSANHHVVSCVISSYGKLWTFNWGHCDFALLALSTSWLLVFVPDFALSGSHTSCIVYYTLAPSNLTYFYPGKVRKYPIKSQILPVHTWWVSQSWIWVDIPVKFRYVGFILHYTLYLPIKAMEMGVYVCHCRPIILTPKFRPGFLDFLCLFVLPAPISSFHNNKSLSAPSFIKKEKLLPRCRRIYGLLVLLLFLSFPICLSYFCRSCWSNLRSICFVQFQLAIVSLKTHFFTFTFYR